MYMIKIYKKMWIKLTFHQDTVKCGWNEQMLDFCVLIFSPFLCFSLSSMKDKAAFQTATQSTMWRTDSKKNLDCIDWISKKKDQTLWVLTLKIYHHKIGSYSLNKL